MVKDESGFAVPAAVMVFLIVASVFPFVTPGSLVPLLLVGIFLGVLGASAAYWLVERAYGA